MSQSASAGCSTSRAGTGFRAAGITPAMSQSRNGFGFRFPTGGTGISFYTGFGTGRSGGNTALVPSVITLRCLNITINFAGFNRSGVSCRYGCITPLGPIGPLLISEQIFVGCIILFIDSYGPVPLTVSTLRAGGELIASVRGIVIVSLRGGCGAVKYVETPVAVGFVGSTGATAVAAPVIPQVSDNSIGVYCGFIGCSFGCSYLFGAIIVVSIGVAGGRETGGPTLNVGYLTGTGFLPGITDQGISRQIGLVRGQGAVIPITILCLRFDQYTVDVRLAGTPVSVFTGNTSIAVTAARASIDTLGIFDTGAVNGRAKLIIMAGGSDLFGIYLSTTGTGFDFSAGLRAGSGLGYNIASIGVTGCFNGGFFSQTTLGTIGDQCAGIGTGCSLSGSGLVAMRAAALADGRTDHRKVMGL